MQHKISKILIATDKFRPKLTAKQACNILSSELSKKYITKSIPLADGGEGSIETIADIIDSETQTITAFDPLFRNIECSYLIEKKNQREKRRAFIEMSRVSGLRLLKKEERNPMKTSTYGTGQMIKDAISKGCDQIVLLIGGSGTNDGGIGAAAALGYKFLDENNNVLVSIGENLNKIEKILAPEKDLLQNVSVQIASDVENPLLGPNGATFIYGPQKGTKPTDLLILEQGLTNLNNKYIKHFKKDFSTIKGVGAAGGLGYGSVAFFNANITSGIKLITEITKLEEQIKSSDIIITGEGKLDSQTLQGKTVYGVLKLAEKYNKPVVVFCGKSELEASSLGNNVTILENEESGMKMEYAIEHAEELMRERVKKYFEL